MNVFVFVQNMFGSVRLCVSAHLGCVEELSDVCLASPVLPCPAGILDQSAVWVDEMNYYDMRTDRNKGISPLSLRPSNPLGIELDKYGPRTCEYTHTKIAQHKHTAINTRALVIESWFTSLNRNKLSPYAGV